LSSSYFESITHHMRPEARSASGAEKRSAAALIEHKLNEGLLSVVRLLGQSLVGGEKISRIHGMPTRNADEPQEPLSEIAANFRVTNEVGLVAPRLAPPAGYPLIEA
jgi:hypothetical protein